MFARFNCSSSVMLKNQKLGQTDVFFTLYFWCLSWPFRRNMHLFCVCVLSDLFWFCPVLSDFVRFCVVLSGYVRLCQILSVFVWFSTFFTAFWMLFPIVLEAASFCALFGPWVFHVFLRSKPLVFAHFFNVKNWCFFWGSAAWAEPLKKYKHDIHESF